MSAKIKLDRRDSLDISLAQFHMDEASKINNRDSFACLKSLFSCFVKT